MEADRSQLTMLIGLAVIAIFFFSTLCCIGGIFARSAPSPSEVFVLSAILILAIGGPWRWWSSSGTSAARPGRCAASWTAGAGAGKCSRSIDAELADTGACWTTGHWSHGTQLLRSNVIAVTRTWLIQARPGHCAVVHSAGPGLGPIRNWSRGECGCPAPASTSTSAAGFAAARLRNVLVTNEATLQQLFEELLERRPGLLTGCAANTWTCWSVAAMRWPRRTPSASGSTRR